MKLNTIDIIALVLVIVGGLNWGLVGLGIGNLVEMIFGIGSSLTMIVYVLVGLSSVYLAIISMKLRRD